MDISLGLGLGNRRRAGNGGNSSATDSLFDKVIALLHGEGLNNAQTFTDQKDIHLWSSLGTLLPYTSTTQKKFGNSSIYFDGATNTGLRSNASIPLDTTQDFTVEAWIYRTTTGRDAIVNQYTGPSQGFGFQVTASDKLAFFLSTTNFSYEQVISAASVPTNEWVHVAGVKEGNTIKVFVNGSLEGTLTLTYTPAGSASSMYIGYDQMDVSRTFTGYIDEIRITVGAARYSSSFSVPSGPFPDAGPDTFNTLYDGYASAQDSVGWGTYTLRQVFPASMIGAASALKITLAGSKTNNGVTISDCFVGIAATSGDAYDFATTPTRVKFGGQNQALAGRGDVITSDKVSLAVAADDNIIVSIYVESGDSVRIPGNPTGATGYWISGNFANVVDAASGYTAGIDGTIYIVTKLAKV